MHAKGGRPRRSGPREPSGRISRRPTEHQRHLRLANAYWRGLTSAMQIPTSRQLGPFQTPDGHPLLHLVRLDKLKVRQFTIALSWAMTDLAIAPRWARRKYLTEISGLDFFSREGCAAARRVVAERLGGDAIKVLDDAVFRGEFRTDLPSLSICLEAIWEAWCSQRQNGD